MPLQPDWPKSMRMAKTMKTEMTPIMTSIRMRFVRAVKEMPRRLTPVMTTEKSSTQAA